MHSLVQDLRFSLRLMRKRSGSTFLVLAALTLGIGLNAGVFSVVNAILLRPLPVFEPDRIVRLQSKVLQTGTRAGTSYPDFLDWRTQSHSFESITAMYFLSFTLTGTGSPEHLKATGISAAGFKTWGVKVILGRDFTDDDDRPDATRVTVLTYPFWQRKFGGDPTIVGKTLTLDDQQYTIVGVLQPTQLNVLGYADIYVADGPLINPHLMERDTRWFFPFGRLKPKVSIAQTRSEMETIAARLAAQYPDTTRNMGITVESMVEQLTADGRKPLLLLILASSLIFLLALLNIATVFMSRTAERAPELSVRLSLGASSLTLHRQLFIQALIFATSGAALGLGLAKLGLMYFLHRFPNAAERFHETTFDSNVVAVTIGLALFTTLVATLPPAFYASRLNVRAGLTGERILFASFRYRWLGSGALIFVQVALASGLSLVAGLLIRSFYQVEKVDLGFNPHHILSFHINPPVTHYKQPLQLSTLYKAAVEKLTTVPGLESVSGAYGLPLTNQGWLNTIQPDAQSPLADKELTVEDEGVLPGYFRLMNISVLQGRDFTDADRESAPPVIIIDDALAAKLWPGQNPLGKRIRMAVARGGAYRWLEVIGVVREIKHFNVERKPTWMQVYVPQYQDPTPDLSFVINTTLPEGTVKAAAEKSVHEIDKDLPVENFQTMEVYFDNLLSGRKVTMLLLSSFAAIGIVLGGIGIYGVVASSVIRRRKEIAIRMAVGSTPSGALLLVTRLGLLATLAGIVVGSLIVLSLARILNSLLYGVSALDPSIYIVAALIVILLALLASIIPAARLFRFNIQQILRQ